MRKRRNRDKGYIQLAMSTGFYADIDCTDIREGEIEGRSRRTGKPIVNLAKYESDEERQSKPIIGYYGYYELKDGTFRFEYWPMDRLLRHADRYSKAFSYEKFKAMQSGEMNPKDVEKPVHSAAIISAVAGVALLLIGLLGSPAMLRLLNTKEDLLPGAILYLRVYFLGMPALALYNFGNAVFSSIGDTKKPLLYLSIAGALNIALNLFFVIVCDLSVVGVALASAISQCVSAFLILRALTRVQDCYALDPHKLQLDPVQAKSILALGVPAGLQNAIFAIANLFIQAGVNSFDSLMVKGNSAAANADGLIYDCMAAFYMACASFMSQNYGAGRPDRVKKSYFISLGYSFGVGLVLGAALFFCGPAFLALFTTETAVIDAGMKRVAVMAFAYCVSAFMDCTIAASRGLGKTVVPTVIVVLGSCVFRVIWVYTIFAHFHTIPALYLLYPCSWILTALAEIAYFASCYKRAMAIFRKPAAA